MTDQINTHQRWMVNSRCREWEVADAELKRRGTVVPDLDVSGHAIDRASTSCWRIYRQTRRQDEGLHAWLIRMTQEAMRAGRRDDKGRYCHEGMRLVVEESGCWPVLKTVIRK